MPLIQKLPDPNNIEVITSPDQAMAMVDPSLVRADPEFNKTLQEIEAHKKQKEEDMKKLQELQVQGQQKQEIKMQPLQLKYIYTGSCPNCKSSNIKTLMVGNEAGYFAICYCLQEDIQLKSQKVVRLAEEKIELKIEAKEIKEIKKNTKE